MPQSGVACASGGLVFCSLYCSLLLLAVVCDVLAVHQDQFSVFNGRRWKSNHSSENAGWKRIPTLLCERTPPIVLSLAVPSLVACKTWYGQPPVITHPKLHECHYHTVGQASPSFHACTLAKRTNLRNAANEFNALGVVAYPPPPPPFMRSHLFLHPASRR